MTPKAKHMSSEAIEKVNPNEVDPTLEADEPDEDYDQPGNIQSTLDYMQTERGHEVTLKIVAMLEQLSPVLKTFLEAKAEAEKSRPKWEFWKWITLLSVRLIVFVVAIGALIYMLKRGSIDPAIALLIGGLVAYFFGYNKSQS